MQIVIGARTSRLAKVQVSEVLLELKQFFPQVTFVEKFVKTKGDKDLKTPLTDLNKTDFFTYEIDQMVLNQECDVGIHSAKDLPEPLHKDLEIAAITKGVCSKDCLVFREGESLSTLPKKPVIGSCSLRRRDVIKRLVKDCVFKDIRGDILQRLELLENRVVDGLVMAHAAIVRLNLNCHKMFLEGETAPLQGQLAVVCRKNDMKMKQIFECVSVMAHT